MCGIAGIFGRPDREALGRMVGAMRHRGPDDAGIFTDEAVAFGHTRLAIIDPSPAGHQPMMAAQGEVVIVYNGEIYNFREERERLEGLGHSFTSDSDTEVLLALYLQHGEDFLARLRGIFSLAIYDRRGGPGRERLLLARDQFGIKPLLYAVRDGQLVFASELKALLASGLVPREIDREALRLLLTFGAVYQPRSLIAGVQSLPAAHVLVAEGETIRISRYWSYGFDRSPGLRKAPYAEQVEAVREVLEDSVRRQMIADVPVGAFLSGGVDSSLIVALMSRHAGHSVKTFSVGFVGGNREHDESEAAASTARLIGTDHTAVVVDEADAEASLFDFIQGLDQPSVDGMNSYFVSRAAGSEVRVSLSGTGGDELFAGYPWFWHVTGEGSRRPWWRSLMSRGNGGEGADFLNAYAQLYHCFGPRGPESLIAGDPSSAEFGGRFVPMAEDLAMHDELSGAPVLDRVSALCLNTYTRSQLLRDIDACSMASSLEVRVPFLDVDVADVAMSLPFDAKLAPGATDRSMSATYDTSGVKRVVVDVAKQILPQEFFAQRGKRGFGLPFADWLRGSLRPVMDEALSPESVERRGLLKPDAVAAVQRDFLAGRRPWNQPWLLLVLELWAREVLHADAPAKKALQPVPVSSG